MKADLLSIAGMNDVEREITALLRSFGSKAAGLVKCSMTEGSTAYAGEIETGEAVATKVRCR